LERDQVSNCVPGGSELYRYDDAVSCRKRIGHRYDATRQHLSRTARANTCGSPGCSRETDGHVPGQRELLARGHYSIPGPTKRSRAHQAPPAQTNARGAQGRTRPCSLPCGKLEIVSHKDTKPRRNSDTETRKHRDRPQIAQKLTQSPQDAKMSVVAGGASR